ncbi:MAG: hypothetical protein J6V26_06165 [Alistipes sp.]|nr:hypothetical protein [Alistipes sp.]
MKQRLINSVRALVVVVAALVACGVESHAQSPVVSGRLSRDSVEVGDQFDYTIDVEVDVATLWAPPVYGDMLTKEQRDSLSVAKRTMSTYKDYNDDILEVIKDYPIDTLKVDGRRLHLRKRYRMAVMETGVIPFVPVIAYMEKNRDVADTLYSRDTLRLNVKGYEELDTTLFIKFDPATNGIVVDSLAARQKLRDGGLFEQKDLPFIFAEVKDYVIYGAMALILLGLVVWLLAWYIARYLRNRAVVPPPAPKIPPHVVANKALVELGHRKLWQKGKFKAYYTALTSILRTYISGRWDIGALEMTTDEIIAALRDVEMPSASRTDLITTLRTADMVKFAKAEPEAEENEESLSRALYFVENTKLVDVERNEGKQDINIKTNIED